MNRPLSSPIRRGAAFVRAKNPRANRNRAGLFSWCRTSRPLTLHDRSRWVKSSVGRPSFRPRFTTKGSTMVRPLSSGTERRGIATVELALVMAILLLPMVVGLVEVGRLNEVQQIMNNAVREGARQGAAGQMSDTQCKSVVRLYLYNEGLPITNAVVTVTNLGFPGNPAPIDNNPQDATDLDQIQVTLTLPYADVAWLNLGLFLTSTTTMTATANWSSCKDRAYPVPVPPPGF